MRFAGLEGGAALEWVEGQIEARMVKGQYTSDLETYADPPLEEIGMELDARGPLSEMRRPPGLIEES